MHSIVVQLDPRGGWSVSIPGDASPRRHFATRRVAECAASEQAAAEQRDVVLLDAYHRVMRPGGAVTV